MARCCRTCTRTAQSRYSARMFRRGSAELITRVFRFVAQYPGRSCVYLLVGTVLIGGALFSLVEPDADWFDGIWWAIVTLTTVGYGDYSPETVLGRWIATFVMAGGIGSVAILTGLLADEIREARVHEHDETPELDDDIERVMLIMAEELEKLRAKVSHPEVVAALRKVHAKPRQEGGALTERRRHRSRDVALVAAAGTRHSPSPPAAATTTAAYCVDENDQIVENRYCDDEATDATAIRRVLLVLRRHAAGGKLRRGRQAHGRRARSSPPTSPRTHARRLRRAARAARERRRPRRRRRARGRLSCTRIEVEPRQGWPAIIEEQGLIYWKTELPDGSMMPYWHESNAYTLTSDEVYEMEASVRLLMEMLVEAGDYIIESNLFSQMGIPGWAVPRIKETWESEPPMLYGRFDFAYGPDGFKLLEYNADTPDRARGDRGPVALGAGRLRHRRRPVEHGPRAARAALEGAAAAAPGRPRVPRSTPTPRTRARTS